MRFSKWSFIFFIAFCLVCLIEPSIANIFAKPIAKGNFIKGGLLNFSKVAIAVCFVVWLIAALGGRLNWRWGGVIVVVAIVIATVDVFLSFLEIG